MFPFNIHTFPFTDFNKLNLDFILDILNHLKGGETGESLVKKTDEDYDFEWIPGGGGGGVISVNGQTGVVVLAIPTKTSDLTNDSGYITSAPVTSVNGQTGAVTVSVPVAATTPPADLNAAAAVGTGTTWARADHVHKRPTASELGVIPAPAAPSNGDVLTWNGAAWVASALPLYNGGVG